MKIKTIAVGLWALSIIFPSLTLAQGEQATTPADVSIGGLEIAMFSASQPVSVEWASQMKLLSNLELSGDILREPDRDFLIFLAGDEFYINGELASDFREFFGGTMLDAIDNLSEPERSCSGQEVALPNGFNGLAVFIALANDPSLSPANCIVRSLHSSWDMTIAVDDGGSFAENLTAFVLALRK